MVVPKTKLYPMFRFCFYAVEWCTTCALIVLKAFASFGYENSHYLMINEKGNNIVSFTVFLIINIFCYNDFYLPLPNYYCRWLVQVKKEDTNVRESESAEEPNNNCFVDIVLHFRCLHVTSFNWVPNKWENVQCCLKQIKTSIHTIIT